MFLCPSPVSFLLSPVPGCFCLNIHTEGDTGACTRGIRHDSIWQKTPLKLVFTTREGGRGEQRGVGGEGRPGLFTDSHPRPGLSSSRNVRGT